MVPGVAAGVFGTSVGFQQITASGSAQSLTIPSKTNPTLAVLISTTAFTWRDDGTAPTLAVGMVWPANVPLYYGGDLAAFKLIATSADLINVSYYE